MFEETSMEDFNNTFETNTTATYFTLLAFLELLDAGNRTAIEGGEGAFGKPIHEGSRVPNIQSQVLVTSSVGAFLRDEGTVPAYTGSKVRFLRHEFVLSDVADWRVECDSGFGQTCFFWPRRTWHKI